MSNSEKNLYLIDAYALIYRAYYAFIRTPRVNSKGLNTSAMFGFTNTLMDVINNFQPSHIAVAFDVSGPVFRNESYPEYKANREETPDDIKISIPYVKRIIRAFNIPILEKEGYEADDIIGTIAKKAAEDGFNVFMVTPDKDFGQLVDERIKMLKPGRQGNAHEIWGAEEVCKKFGIKRTDQVIDMLGMWGDSVDNIPGIPGVGEKTAQKLLAEYDSLENLLEHSEEIKGKLGEKIRDNVEQARLSKQLATIICDAPVKFNPEDLRLDAPNKDQLREIFAELEFRTLSERILGEKMRASGEQMDLFSEVGDADTLAPSNADSMQRYDAEAVSYKIIDSLDKRKGFVAKLLEQEAVCFDTETSALNPHEAELVGIAFSWKEGEAYYLPLPEKPKALQRILEDLDGFFSSKKILKIGHNLKYDLTVLHWAGVEVQGPFFDTMLAHYLLKPEMKHSMDELAETYLGYRPISIESLIGKKGKGQKSMRDLPVEEVGPYACEDADITYRLYLGFDKMVQEEKWVHELLHKIELPLMPVLMRMEAHGVNLDKEALAEISKKLGDEVEKLEKEIYEAAGRSFNIGSPKQLGEILFDELKIDEKPKKTKSGQYATNEETLQKYAEHEIVGKLLDYRQITKLKSTYVDSLPELINPRDQRIHSTFMQAVTSTGRLSSQNPNLQNIPIRTERGREVRKAFVAADDEHCIFAADYSQIELRIMAELSGDEGMLEAFEAGKDIHAATAAKVFGVKPDEVSREMRSRAKVVNFGIIYGISAFGLSQRIGISRTEAGEIIDSYFKQYPKVKAYMDQCIANAREQGYVETIEKRRRYLPDINSRNATVRGFAERNAINTPIQGSAADMIKLAMIRIDDAMHAAKLKSKLILQVHDELVFDARKEELEELMKLVEKHMREAMPSLRVPIKVDMDTGANWLEAH